MQKHSFFIFISVCIMFIIVLSSGCTIANSHDVNMNSSNKIEELDTHYMVKTPQGKTIKFDKEYNLSKAEMLELAADFDNQDTLEDSENMDEEESRGISPGETKKFRVWRGNHDNLYSSTNGIRTFTIWVPDSKTVVEATWYEETLGGYNWVYRGKETVKGKNIKFSRTVNLKPTENFKIRIKGVTPSSGKRRISYYYVSCSKKYLSEVGIHATNKADTSKWFKAGPYQKWYWGGCTTWMVVNDVNREILLVDGYVSKATLGANHDYNYDTGEQYRLARFVNIIRSFIARGYSVKGILTSHRHGDHVGDIPYILGGIRQSAGTNFMEIGRVLSGSSSTARIPVVMNQESCNDPYYGDDDYRQSFYKPTSQDIVKPTFNGSTYIDGKDFTVGSTLTLGRFEIIPYIWYHGRFADGVHDDIRTLAYNIRCTSSSSSARTFITTGYVERSEQVYKINKTIYAHHLIFGWNGSDETAKSAKNISLLSNSPVGSNYIFTNHTDKNSSTSYGVGDAYDDARDMMGGFVEYGLLSETNLSTYWRGIKMPIKMGVFHSRLGD